MDELPVRVGPSVMQHRDCPFTRHPYLSVSDLEAGQPKTLELLCDATFGPVWWQLVAPWLTTGALAAVFLVRDILC